ncbi:MAG: hypothetical protein AAB467_02220 [Patescibacteria group bacterium]
MFKYPKAQKVSPSPREGGEGLVNPANPPLPRPSGDLATAPVEAPKKDVSPEALRELLEKNLKWSQIIYEQTRLINSKLFWKSVWGWAMFIIFVVAPTAMSVWFLPRIIRELETKYQPYLNLLGSGQQTSTAKGQSSIDDILKLLPITDEQKVNLKAILGTK